jgi:CubicO group peptidase (beta-lactamase class C family)
MDFTYHETPERRAKMILLRRYGLLISTIFCILFLGVSVSVAELPLAEAEKAGMSEERLTLIDGYLNSVVDQDLTKGAVAAVARRGKLVYLKAFGQMDDARAMKTDTIFRICSQSKLVTTIGAMILYEQGRLKLEDVVSKYLPEFKDMMVAVEDKESPEGYKLEAAKRQITIRDLMTHTDGFTYGFWGRPHVADFYEKYGVSDGLIEIDIDLEENMKRLAKCPLMHQPGEAYEYGLGIDVLGRVIEVISGMPLDKFLDEKLFKPLGMKDTHFFLPQDKVDRLTAVYARGEDGKLAKFEKFSGAGWFGSKAKTLNYDSTYSYQGPQKLFSGGGGLNGTIMDYMLLMQMLLNKGELNGARILSPLTIELMTRNHIGDLWDWVWGEKGWKHGLGAAVLMDRDMQGFIASNGSFMWGGWYRTRYLMDFKNDLCYALYFQVPPLHSDWANITLTFRQLVYSAVVGQ